MSQPTEVQVLGQTQRASGFLKVLAYQIRYALFGGGLSPAVNREVMTRGRAVAALPYDPSTDEVLLIEQFRIGPFHAGDAPWIWEVVAGMMDVYGETPEQALRRELAEEAGIQDADLVHIVDYYPSPGGSDEQILLYLAKTDLSAIESGQRFGVGSEAEDIQVHKLPRSQWRDWQERGRLNNAATLLSLMWLDQQQDVLREL